MVATSFIVTWTKQSVISRKVKEKIQSFDMPIDNGKEKIFIHIDKNIAIIENGQPIV